MSDLPAILGGTPTRTKPYPQFNTIGPKEREFALQVLDSGVLSDFVAHDGPSFNGGARVRELESAFCSVFGSRFAVSMNSATSGIHAAILAAQVGLGDEVIVPPYTMSATATMVAAANGTPIFADVDASTYCIDVGDVVRKLSPRTKAIIAVNLFGGPAALVELRELADQRGIVLIEDNAQSPGGKIGGRYTGTIGHLGVFSLNFHKTIQCGEGGVVVTNDDHLAERLRLVRNHGEVVQSQRSSVPAELVGLLGFNYRLTELQAAIAIAQLERLEELTEPRIAAAAVLTSGIRGLPGIKTPTVAENCRHVYYMYALQLDPSALGLSRKQLKYALEAERVFSSEGYVRPIYLYPMYERTVGAQREGFGAGIWHSNRQVYGAGLCPTTERLHFSDLLLTNVCRHDLGTVGATEFANACTRIVEHRDAVRRKCVADGVA